MERKLVWVCDPFIMETEPNLVDYPGLSLQPLLPREGQRGSPGGARRAHPSPLQFRNPGNVYNKVKAQTCKSLIRLSASCPVELAGGG